MNTILATDYRLHYYGKKGKEHSHVLTGEETVSTTCPECGKIHFLEWEHFMDIMKDGELYGTMVYCPDCGEKRMAEGI